MRHYYSPILLAAILATSQLTSCTDDNYDLSDIDTTTKVQVNDLVLPLNMKDIQMKSIIEPEGLLQVKDGQYCIVMQGDKEPGEQYAFSSDEIKIDAVTLTVNDIDPTRKEFDVPTLPDIPVDQIPDNTEPLIFPLDRDLSPLDIGSQGVPAEITAIDSIGTHIEISFTISLTGSGNDKLDKLEGFTIEGLQLQLPKGLEPVKNPDYQYDKLSGILQVRNQYITGNSKTMTFSCDRINLEATGIDFNNTTQEISYNGEIGVIDGKVQVSVKALKKLDQIPSKIYYNVDYTVKPIPVKSFSGGLKYDVPEIVVPEISLGDLPDVLTQSGTKIALKNPQIYLSLNNPIASKFLQKEKVGSLGLNIKAKRAGDAFTNCPMGGTIDIMPEEHVKYVLSPSVEGLLPPYEFKKEGSKNELKEGVKHVKYPELSNVVYGDGLPLSLTVEPTPTIGNNEKPDEGIMVDDLELGVGLGKFTGDYYLRVPLQLTDMYTEDKSEEKKSTIIYSGTADGWGGDDLEDLTVNKLAVSAKVSTDIPVDITISMDPVNSQGNIIPTKDKDPVTVTVPANADNRDFKIVLEGDIKDLDGVRYVATAIAAKDGAPLSENMKIELKQIRATVSGYYTTDF